MSNDRKLNTSDKKLVKMYRDMLAKMHPDVEGKALTDLECITIIEATENDDDTAADAERIAQMVATINKKKAAPLDDKREGAHDQPLVKSSSAQTEQERLASKFALKLSEETTNHLVESFDAQQRAKGSAVIAYLDMRRDFTDDELAAMPKPGTGPTDPKLLVGKNILEDVVMATRTKKDGKLGPKRISYWQTMAERSKRGQECLAIIEKAERDEKAGAPNKRKRNEDKADAQSALSNLKTNVIKGWNIWHQMKAFGSHLKDFTVEIATPNSKGNYTAKPFYIYLTAAASSGASYTVDQFLRFDPEKAAATGNTMEALFDTLSTGGGGEGDGKDGDIKSTEEGMLQFTRVVNWMTSLTNTQMINLLSAKSGEQKELVGLMGGMYFTLDSNKRYWLELYKAQERENLEAKNKEAAAKNAAAESNAA